MKRIYLFVITFFWFSVVCNAGVTGKISGKVIDANSKEPLIGANVVIAGTSMGAATDADGEFYIINIPPGIYSVAVSMVGYTKKVIENVRVQVDLTVRLDVELFQTSVEVDEVTIVGARREIQKDLSSSERTFQKDQINILPARDVSSILSLQAGVTRDASGELHIRGGRSSEIIYMVDGLPVINAVNRSAGISIDDQSIEELKTISGTFNAEYGQALSGVVNIVTKRGSEKFLVSAVAYVGDYLSFDKKVYSVMSNRGWTNFAATMMATRNLGWALQYLEPDFISKNFSSFEEFLRVMRNDVVDEKRKTWLTNEPYLNKYNPFRRYDLQLNISGPLFSKYVSYFVAGRYNYAPGAEKGYRYFMPWGIWQPVRDTVNTFQMPDGKLVPLNWYEGYSTQSKVFLRLPSGELSYGFYYNNDHSYSSGGVETKYRPDGGRHYYTERRVHMLSLTHVFSPKTFLELKTSWYKNHYKSYLYESPYDYRYVPTDFGNWQGYVFGETFSGGTASTYDFLFWGNDATREGNTVKYFSIRGDLTCQINKHNLIKFGVGGIHHYLEPEYYQLDFSKAGNMYRPSIPETFSPYYSHYKAHPYEISSYIQDKIEFEELVINIGLRFDYFDSDGKVLADPTDPQIYSPFKMEHKYKNYTDTTAQSDLIEYSVEERAKFWFKKATPKHQFSPRLGISFPISAEGVLHFSYGHFFQNPPFQYLYVNPNFWIEGAGAQNLVGNADLNAERTVMYELGVQQKLFENVIVHATGFYRDIRDWIGSGYPIATAKGTTYYSYVNRDHAVVRGITLSGSLYFDPISINIDYTYMQAKGTSSSPYDAYNDLIAGRAPRLDLVYLNWDQPHSLNVVANYNRENWNVTIVGSIKSGFPYTPTLARGEAVGSQAYTGWQENSERRPSNINFDLHIGRKFAIGKLNFEAIVDARNLFDTRNALYVYTDTGMPDFSLDDYQRRNRFLEISKSTEYFNRSGNFTEPRSITFGLRIIYE